MRPDVTRVHPRNARERRDRARRLVKHALEIGQRMDRHRSFQQQGQLLGVRDLGDACRQWVGYTREAELEYSDDRGLLSLGSALFEALFETLFETLFDALFNSFGLCFKGFRLFGSKYSFEDVTTLRHGKRLHQQVEFGLFKYMIRQPEDGAHSLSLI